MPYFNYRLTITPAAEASLWQRREWLHAWWSIYADDPRWTPPDYRRLARELQPRHNPHLARLRPLLVSVEALYRTGLRTARQDQPVPLSSILERPLAAAVGLYDPRRDDRTGYLALLQTANDREALERLVDGVGDALRPYGVRRILASTGLSPHIGSGIQTDAWDSLPPVGAPSNPPYLPELLTDLTQPHQTGELYRIMVPPDAPATSGPATLRPLDPQHLAGDLLSLWTATAEADGGSFPPPDEAEAAFILRGMGASSLGGWVAETGGRPVGFVLLGPDTATALRRAEGGRRPYRRPLLAAERALRTPTAGRLFAGGVLPDRRRLGIGRQLWAAALATGLEQGWDRLSIGPVWSESAAGFLAAQGATVVQTAEVVAFVI